MFPLLILFFILDSSCILNSEIFFLGILLCVIILSIESDALVAQTFTS